MRKHPDQDDAMYLSMRRGKMTVAEIAAACGVSERTVYYGIGNARQIEANQAMIARAKADAARPAPRAEILFGSSCKPWALTTCEDIHPGGPIPKGSDCMCGKCHDYGRDDHPALQRSPLTDPAPEPKPRPAPKPKQTRKQKRRAQVAA